MRFSSMLHSSRYQYSGNNANCQRAGKRVSRVPCAAGRMRQRRLAASVRARASDGSALAGRGGSRGEPRNTARPAHQKPPRKNTSRHSVAGLCKVESIHSFTPTRSARRLWGPAWPPCWPGNSQRTRRSTWRTRPPAASPAPTAARGSPGSPPPPRPAPRPAQCR